MRQQLKTRASKIAGGAVTGVFVLAIVAFWAAVAVFAWEALKPYRLIVVDLWELIPPGARGEVGIGLGIAGGSLLVLLVVAGYLGQDEPVRQRGGARQTYVGVDIDAADIDVSGM